MRIHHLSHIDLDGYGCQYLTTRAFDDIQCYNANYGPEVTARLGEILNRIKEERLRDPEKEFLILITDLNLSTKECNALEKGAMEAGAKLQLLDHHGTGASAAERFAWYTLDTSRSATKITYDWLREHFGFDPEGHYEKIVEAINAIDIWVEESPYFPYGKVLLGMISGAREVNRILFPDEDRAYKLSLIDTAAKILEDVPLEEAPIVLDEALHSHKKAFFRLEKNDTKDNLVANYVTRLLSREKDRLTINYKGYKGLLGYNVGNTSLIGNAFLLANPDYDFYMDVNSRGNFSLRSNNKLDVSAMAAEIGNGGGHPNASGGKIENYKDSFVYSDLRDFIQNYIDEKSAQPS
ncbi:DHH family phosphoesterase [Nitratifractor salsuginis]|uniref:Phosphoesterase DHHA1 n=1 Tax=Nitratifractor salsuginis (strain DSM 16511 / JCM 12458 / E9I37-1) TaxID=749222 RepID=E6X0L8_NITSE|nr:DHHA1 domain-containing protein [Nitratifractor salsuginis]ADV45738.1 phosphoesterase DHHA1 [Nitratifractor salsuginis DSM 16511]